MERVSSIVFQAAPDGGGPQGAYPAGMPHLAPGFIAPPSMSNQSGLPPPMFNMPPPGFGMPGYVPPEGKSFAANGDSSGQIK